MKMYNRYRTEQEAQEAFIKYCDEHPNCSYCPMAYNTLQKKWSCAIHFVYSRFDQNQLCREAGRPESKKSGKKKS